MTNNSLIKGFHIPPRPEVLISFASEAKSKEPSIDRLAEILRTDVSLMGSLLQLVNSPYIGVPNPITSADQSITLLGIARTTTLVRSVALRSSIGNALALDRFWDTASETAQICDKLAMRFTGVSNDDAYTLGLFHDCGIPLMMQHFSDYKETLKEANETQTPLTWLEDTRYNVNHCQVGRQLAEHWFLPDYISQSIEYLPVYEDALSGTIKLEARTPPLLAILCAAKHISNHYRQLWRVYDIVQSDSISPLVLEHLNISSEDFHDEMEILLSSMSDN